MLFTLFIFGSLIAAIIVLHFMTPENVRNRERLTVDSTIDSHTVVATQYSADSGAELFATFGGKLIMSEITGYAIPYTTQIQEAMQQLDAVWYRAHNSNSEAMQRIPKSYDHFRLVFKASSNTWDDVKETLRSCGLAARSVSKAYDADGLLLRECKIELVKPVVTKKLNRRDMQRALKQSERDAQKFAVRMN